MSRLAVLVLTLLAFGLRLWGLGAHSVWLDEALMLNRATADLRTVIEGHSALDLAPPLAPLVWRAWTLLGEADFFARFPSALFSALTVAVLARAVPVGGLGAALIFALAPVQVHYAQEATVYGLVGLLAALALLAATWIDRRDRRGWLALTVVAVLSAYTYYGLLFLIGCLYLWGVARRWTSAKPPALGLLLAALACLPLLPLVLRQSAAGVEAWWGQYGRLDGVEGVQVFTQGLLAHGLAFPLFPFSQPPLWFLIGVGVVVAVGAVRRPALFLAGWLGPLALAYVTSAWGRYPFETRYLLFAAPSLYVLLGAALTPPVTRGRTREFSTAEAQRAQRKERSLYPPLRVFASWPSKTEQTLHRSQPRVELCPGENHKDAKTQRHKWKVNFHPSSFILHPLHLLLAALLVSAWPAWGLDLPWGARPPREEVRSLLAVLAERRAPDDAVYVSYGARAVAQHYQRLGLAPADAWLEEGWPAGRVEVQADHVLAAGAGRARVWVLVAHAQPDEERALAEALARRGVWLRERAAASGAAVWRLETGD